LRRASNKRTLRVLAMLTVSQLSKSFADRALFGGLTNRLLAFCPLQLSSRIESQLRSYRESELHIKLDIR
jgi:hypothetical protein